MVPNRYKEDRVLGKWVSHLREYYTSNQLSEERIKALEAIGFVWNPHLARWNASFERLKAYKEKFGDCRVPTFFKDDKALGKWVARQREDANDGVIQPDRKKKLEDLGFIWQLKKKCNPEQRNTKKIDEKWEGHYQKLVKYSEEHGHVNVPDDWVGDKTLSKWVKGQRVIYNRNLMPKERLKKLRDIGFIFGFQAQKKQKNWNRMYDLLKQCQKEGGDGTFQVALVGDDAPSLARWIQRQRESYRAGKMEVGREILLRKLNFHLPDKVEEGTAVAVVEAAASVTQQSTRKPPTATTAIGTVENTAGGEDSVFKPGTDVGKMVAESINVLAKFMTISPEDVASRLSYPGGEAAGRYIERPAASTGGKGSSNAFGRLMPLIVKLRETVDEADMWDCGDFIIRMLQDAKEGFREELRNSDVDAYNRLLALTVDLSAALDSSDKSLTVIQGCEGYLEHIMIEKGSLKRSAAAMAGMAMLPVAQRRRI